MNKIATCEEINAKIGSNLSPRNYCPTKNEIIRTEKATISGSYHLNQCVKWEDINLRKPTCIIEFQAKAGTQYITWESSFQLKCKVPVTITYIDDDGIERNYSTELPARERYGHIEPYPPFQLDLKWVNLPISDDFFYYRAQFESLP